MNNVKENKMVIYGEFISSDYEKEKYKIDLTLRGEKDKYIYLLDIDWNRKMHDYRNLERLFEDIRQKFIELKGEKGIGEFEGEKDGMKVVLDNKCNIIDFKIMKKYNTISYVKIEKDIVETFNDALTKVYKFNEFNKKYNEEMYEYNVFGSIVMVSKMKDGKIDAYNCSNFLKGIKRAEGLKIIKEILNYTFISKHKNTEIKFGKNTIVIKDYKIDKINVINKEYNLYKNNNLLMFICNFLE